MIRSALPRVPAPVTLVAVSLLLAACGGTSVASPSPSSGGPPADCARVDARNEITLSADDLEFSAPCLVATAGEPFTISFTNEEPVPHNVAIHRDSARDNEIFRGEIITGPDATVVYEIEALEVGEHYFECTVHPAMNGPLYVIEP